MNTISIAWIVLPFVAGFLIFLLPKLDRYLGIFAAIVSAGYALQLITSRWRSLSPGESTIELLLLDNFGVTLLIDSLSGYFILTNALVTAAVILYCWQTEKVAFFYGQLIILHGSLNAAFACTDFVSLYVALEVSGIAAALLIAYPRTDRSIWVALRYLLVSNVAMLFYLVGAVLVYKAHHSFTFAGLRGAPPEALALIFMGLMTKGGVFVSGLWLPMTHSESETPVSAMLSGIVVKAGVYPLVRCALILDEIDPIIRVFGVGTAVLGVSYAIFEQDTKRMLAASTLSQLGFILAAPEASGFYALTHGLAKSALFMLAGALQSRNFKELQQQPIDRTLWILLAIAGFSISGFPLLSGFGAKVLTMKNLLPWQEIVMNMVMVGTAIAFAKFIFLPQQPGVNTKPIKLGFWLAIGLLIGGLFVANVIYFEAYDLKNTIKAIAIIATGWIAYLAIFRRTSLKLPRIFEQFDDLIGVMTLVSILLFWATFV